MFTRWSAWVGSALLACSLVATGAEAQPARGGNVPSIGDWTNGLKKIDGYFPVYWDEYRLDVPEIPRLEDGLPVHDWPVGRSSARMTSASTVARATPSHRSVPACRPGR